MKPETQAKLIQYGKKIFGFKKKPTVNGLNQLIEYRKRPKFYPLADLGKIIKHHKKNLSHE